MSNERIENSGGNHRIDLTGSVQSYIECASGIWNSFLRPRSKQGRNFDSVAAFEAICEILFSEMVLRRVARQSFRKPTKRSAYPFLFAVPKGDTVAALVQRPSSDGNRYWDDPTSRLDADGLRLALVGNFDWDDFAERAFQYFRVVIESTSHQTHLLGREALVEVKDVRIVYEDECADPEQTADQ